MTFISYRERDEALPEGTKADDEKVRMDLVPPDVLYHVGEVLTFGAKKYAPRNWEKGIKYGRVIGGALRHLLAIMRGEDFDPETGYLHSAHAICCLMFLCGYQLRGMTQFDDRNKLGNPVAWKAGFEATIPPNPLDDVRVVVEGMEQEQKFEEQYRKAISSAEPAPESWREPIVQPRMVSFP